MRCLVLGGGGFIGSHICDALLKNDYEVRVFERERVSRENVEHLVSGIEWVEGDFTNIKDVKDLVRGVDYVVHTVCTTQPKSSNQNPAYDVTTNLVSTINLLDVLKESDVRKVIFLSSGGTVYGIPGRIPIPEDHPAEPICSYGIQKLAIEKYLALYRRLHGVDYGVMRVSNPYGPRQRPVASQGAVTVFLYKALRGEQIEIWGDGSVTRDYIYVSDVADAAVSLLGYEGPERVFNIGSGEGLSLTDLVEAIEKTVGRKVDVRFTEARKFDVPVNVLDITRAGRELSWKPVVSFEEGLKRTMAYLAGRL